MPAEKHKLLPPPPLSDDNVPRYLHYSSNTGAHGNVPYYFQCPNTYGKMQID